MPRTALTIAGLFCSGLHLTWLVRVVLRNFNLLRVVLDHPRRVATLGDVPDHHLDFAFAILAGVRLWRLAPPAIKQDVGGLHARGGWVLWLPHD